MQNYNKEFGYAGEEYAASYLIDKGYRILENNASSRWGEIDIIAQKGEIIVFIEVKSRRSTKQGRPYEAVTYGKIKKLQRSMQYYIMSNGLEKRKFQLDVVGIVFGESGHVLECRHYENVPLSR